MSITEILEKYTFCHEADENLEYVNVIHENSIPALERDLSQLLEDRAKEFVEWAGEQFFMHGLSKLWCSFISIEAKDNDLTTSELYALFLTNKK